MMNESEPNEIPDVFDIRWPIAMHGVLDEFENNQSEYAETVLREDLFRVGTILDDEETLNIADTGSKEELLREFRRFVGFVEFKIFEL